MSWRNEYWKNKGRSKHNLKETILPKPQSSTVSKTDSVSSQKSLKPALSLSPTGSKSAFFKEFPNGSEKNESYERVSGQLKRSVSKISLKKISRENSCLTTHSFVSDFYFEIKLLDCIESYIRYTYLHQLRNNTCFILIRSGFIITVFTELSLLKVDFVVFWDTQNSTPDRNHRGLQVKRSVIEQLTFWKYVSFGVKDYKGKLADFELID